MESCIFCEIVKGSMDAAKVYEDNDILVFLDIYPESRGHCLVIPKRHVKNIYEISEANLEKVAIMGKKVAEKLKKTFDADGILLKQANSKAAGQVIFHYHLHVIPKYNQDGIVAKPDMEELKKLAEQLKI